MREGAILLVDDNSDNVQLARLAIQDSGVPNEVVAVRDGLAALELLLAPISPLRPALVLLDLNMPRMDGLETLRRLRADSRTRVLTVIVVSGSDRPEDIALSYRAGADGYVSRAQPFARFKTALCAAVRDGLTLGLAASPRI